MLPNRIEKSPPIEAAAGVAWNAVKMKGYPMNTQQSSNKTKIRRGMALVAAMIFVMVFMAVSVGMMTMSSTNIQSAANHRYANSALNAALSGLEVARYHIQQAPVIETYSNTVSDEEADQMWDKLYSHLQRHSAKLGGKTEKKKFANKIEIRTGWVSMNESATPGNAQGVAWAWGLRRRGSAAFSLCFFRYNSDPRSVYVHSIGRDNESEDDEQTITRTIEMKWLIAKQSAVLEYAVASRGRIWVEQGSLVHGPLFSTWNRPEISAGIQTAADTIVKGTINTAIPLEDLQKHRIQMETLDENNQPVFDEEGNRVHSPKDTIQGQHDGINYDVPYNDDMPGMRPEDYNTSSYKAMCAPIGNSEGTVSEYFPYAEGNYSRPKSSSSIKYTRRVYQNRTLNNIRVPQGQHALFKKCTFEGILFIEALSNYSDNISCTNNIRFEDCTFKGIIVTDVPSAPSNYAWWMRNSLTFTGTSTFENTSSFQEATVLAPNFNVNIGSTAQVGKNSNNIIKGAIVGGIVDVYGDATIHGTIISMYDTSAHTSGYVTNIGDAEDGGSESNGNIVGQIEIMPDPDQLLPSGIKSPIVFKVLGNSYTEVPRQRTSED